MCFAVDNGSRLPRIHEDEMLTCFILYSTALFIEVFIAFHSNFFAKMSLLYS